MIVEILNIKQWLIPHETSLLHIFNYRNPFSVVQLTRYYYYLGLEK